MIQWLIFTFNSKQWIRWTQVVVLALVVTYDAVKVQIFKSNVLYTENITIIMKVNIPPSMCFQLLLRTIHRKHEED